MHAHADLRMLACIMILQKNVLTHLQSMLSGLISFGSRAGIRCTYV